MDAHPENRRADTEQTTKECAGHADHHRLQSDRARDPRVIGPDRAEDAQLPAPLENLRREQVKDTGERHGDHEELNRVGEGEGSVYHALVIGERLWDREHLDQMRAAKLPRDSAPRLLDVRARSEEEVEVAHLRVVPEARELVAVQDDRPLVSAVVSRHDRANSERLRATRCGEGDRLAGREPEAICQVVRDDNSLAPGDGPDRISRVPTNDLPPEQVGVDEAGGDGHRRDARAPVLLAGKDSVRLEAGDARDAAQRFPEIRAERRLQPPPFGRNSPYHENPRPNQPTAPPPPEA